MDARVRGGSGNGDEGVPLNAQEHVALVAAFDDLRVLRIKWAMQSHWGCTCKDCKKLAALAAETCTTPGHIIYGK